MSIFSPHFVCFANVNTPASTLHVWTEQETIKSNNLPKKLISIKGKLWQCFVLSWKILLFALFSVFIHLLVSQVKPLTVLLWGHELCLPFTSA